MTETQSTIVKQSIHHTCWKCGKDFKTTWTTCTGCGHMTDPATAKSCNCPRRMINIVEQEVLINE